MDNVTQRNLFIERYMPLAKKLARNKHRSIPYINIDEFVSAAYTGLVDAASRYEECKGKPAKYLRTRINGEMQDYLRSLGFGSKGSVSRGCTKFDSLDASVGSDGESSISFLEARPSADLSVVFNEAVESLDEDGRQIFKMRFLDEMPLEEIGRELGVSESRVSQRISQYRRQLVATAA